MKLLRILLLAVFASSVASAAAESVSTERIDALARRTIDELSLTGLSLTVVTDDEVLFQESYGLRDIVTKEKVGEDTLFPFGSIGKAFTTTALAMLVDEGKLDWDDPVKNFIPEFEMSDPYITNEFSVRDLLTHRSGLPLGAGDLLFVPDGDADIAGILAAIKHIPPETSFRSEFAYDNLMYILAGEVVSRVEGRPWADVIRSRLFRPLDMDDCRALPSRAAQARNTVTQHSRAPGSKAATRLDPRYILSDSTAPAGGISCSIRDLSKWAQFWLNEGKAPSGKRLISNTQLKELWTGVTPTRTRSDLAKLAGSHFSLYALGWSLSDFHGELLVSHGGGVLGAVAYFALLPEQNIAAFATANDFVPGLQALPLQILSEYVAPEAEADFIASASARYEQYRTTAQKDAGHNEDAAPETAAEPVRPLPAYVGEYVDPWYGKARVEMREGRLFLDMGRSEALDAPLIPVDEDTFLARWPDRSLNADAYVMFALEEGSVVAMTMKAVSDTTDFSFDFHDLKFVKRD